MTLSDSQIAFLEQHHSAAMITVGAEGVPKVARVGVAVVDGKVWSSGTEGRLRTRRLKSDPRCTLYVHESRYAWLTMETKVEILDGDDAPQLNLELFRIMQNQPSGPLRWFGDELDETAFLERMRLEDRLIYQFDVHHTYGMH